jgi:tetratricopeptide (TPR) repeat protein
LSGAGDAAGARKTLDGAIKLVDDLKGTAESRAGALAQVGLAQARLGQRDRAARTFRRAIDVARSAEHPLVASSALYAVARALVRAGDPGWGWEVWEGVRRNDPGARRSGVALTADLSALLAKAGDVARARTALTAALADGKGAWLGSDWAGADATLVKALLATGEKAAARKHLDVALRRARALPDTQKIGGPPGKLLPRPNAVVTLAPMQARVGDKAGAIKELAQVQAFLAGDKTLTEDYSGYHKARCLAHLATAWAAIGEARRAGEPLRLALMAAEGIKHPDFKRAALAEVALARGRRGDWPGTVATVRLLDGRGFRAVEQLSEHRAREGMGKEVAVLAGALTDPILRARAYLGLARALTNERELPRAPLRGPKNGPAERPASALPARQPATKDLDAICRGLDASAAAWKKQTRWMFRYVYSGVPIDPVPGTAGNTPPNEMINARNGEWLAGREAQFVTGRADANWRLRRWHVWRDGKYTGGDVGWPIVTEDRPDRLGNCLFFVTAFGLDNLPVPLLESALRRDRELKVKLAPAKEAARKLRPMFLLPQWLHENTAKYQVRAELEPIDGHLCHVVEWPGRDVVWVDAAAGFSVRRRIVRSPSGAVVVELSGWGYREMRPGVWIPLRFDSVNYNAEDAPARYRGKVAKTINMTLLEARFGKDVPDELFDVRRAPRDRKE